jgi:hypothetical protein
MKLFIALNSMDTAGFFPMVHMRQARNSVQKLLPGAGMLG